MVRATGLFEVTHSICAALQGLASLEGGDKCIECPATGVRHLERVLTVVWGVVLTRINSGLRVVLTQGVLTAYKR